MITLYACFPGTVNSVMQYAAKAIETLSPVNNILIAP